MDFPSSPDIDGVVSSSSSLPDFILIILFLLPGFVAAWLFYNLTAHPRLSPFERIIQALIFTAFIQVFVVGLRHLLYWIGSRYGTVGDWDTEVEFACSLAIAVGLGTLTSFVANNDLLHEKLRRFPLRGLSITKRTSFPTEWFSAFNSHPQYVILHLAGARRVYGWPDEWPNQPDTGHFALEDAEWLLDDNTRVPLRAVEKLLVRAEDVEMVEILKQQLPVVTDEEVNT